MTDITTHILDAALDYAARGWHVFPCWPGEKQPFTKHGLDDATVNVTKIRQWWKKADLNVAIATGAVSGIVVIDVDDDHDGSLTLDALQAAHGPLPATLTQLTGNGAHYLFAHPGGDIRNTAGKLGPGIDTRGDGGYIIAAPSIHPSGAQYEWLNPDTAPAPLPQWVAELLEQKPAPPPRDYTPPRTTSSTNGTTPYAAKVLDERAREVADALEGNRNHTLNQAAFRLGQLVAGGQITEPEVETALTNAAGAAGLDAREIAQTIRSGLNSGTKTPQYPSERAGVVSTPRTEVGTAERTKNAATSVSPQVTTAPQEDTPPVEPPGTTPPVEPPPPDDSFELEHQPPVRFECTDDGNALRLVDLFGADLRYEADGSRWFHWDGTRWAYDVTHEVDRCARKVIGAVHHEWEAEPQGSTRAKDLAKHWVKTQSAERLGAMVRVAQSDLHVQVRARQLDADPWTVNARNGTIDLRTGELHVHDRADLITRLAPITYDPNATCPRWEAFIDWAMQSDPELVQFLQRAIGYSLTGRVDEQVLFFCWGAGSNGKSTFLGVLQALLGEDDDGYALAAPPNLLLASRDSEHPTAIASLEGRRFVVSHEAEQGRRFDEALVKQLTGGDLVTARRMRQDFFTFRPTHKLWFAANHKPDVRGTDHAIWRRIRLIPFSATMPDADQDTKLGDKLRAELPGILNWAINGCADWQAHRLGLPSAVAAATTEYRHENDHVGRYLDERCVLGPNHWVAAKELREDYIEWCNEVGERPISARAMAPLLREHGLENRKDHRSVTTWRGVDLGKGARAQALDLGEQENAPLRAPLLPLSASRNQSSIDTDNREEGARRAVRARLPEPSEQGSVDCALCGRPTQASPESIERGFRIICSQCNENKPF